MDWTTDPQIAFKNAVAEIESVRRNGETTLNLAGPYAALERLPDEISSLTNLQYLNLNRAGVSDISAARNLPELRGITLDHTQINDLRPLCELPLLWTGDGGLSFDDTPSRRNDLELAKLDKITDRKKRDYEIQAYLKSLPPWPQPLSWSMPDVSFLDSPLEPPEANSIPKIVAGPNGSGSGPKRNSRH